MQPHTLHAIEEVLSKMERPDLEELAFEYAKSHASVCAISDAGEAEVHADDGSMADRIGAMSTEQIATMLAPAAWIAVTAHELMSGA